MLKSLMSESGFSLDPLSAAGQVAENGVERPPMITSSSGFSFSQGSCWQNINYHQLSMNPRYLHSRDEKPSLFDAIRK